MNKMTTPYLRFKNFNQWPFVQNYLLLGPLAIIILNCWLVLWPAHLHYSTLINQERLMRSEFEKKYYLTNTTAYYKQLNLLNNEYRSSLKLLVNSKEMNQILDNIWQAGIKAGLTFKLFIPETEKIRKFYIEKRINIIVVGEYQSFALFSSYMAQLSRLVTWSDFNITPRPDDLLQMKLTVKMYKSINKKLNHENK
ncbi:type 4a pilus biogenesis protein PilO [Legionella fairfieldensis]|uniref:type 4a pilus biogenesis protein PilO n=1 Tax=Legionella fairfieldensis TaxID=45064 RepID=UPI00049103C3|nr:type 4a pilus biogenesis protein PilO [Legionella fairfieldensis]